jgi:citrate lyase beta subunit
MNNDAISLGASLYCPATRTDLIALGNGKLPRLRSLIYCLEDSVHEHQLEYALENLRWTLPQLDLPGPTRFIRVRNPRIAETVSGFEGLSAIAGVVVPKLNLENLDDYLNAIHPSLNLMLTLETKEVFSVNEMEDLRDALLERKLLDRITSLRIGGNDLLSLLGLRRARNQTVHEGVLGFTIAQLVNVFRPYGFNLTSPVYEVFDDPITLQRESIQDLERGLFGKTIIHPTQIEVIERTYRVAQHDLEQAELILQPHAEAVFAMNGTMCEVSTHRAWAERMMLQAAIYGIQATSQATSQANNQTSSQATSQASSQASSETHREALGLEITHAQ